VTPHDQTATSIRRKQREMETGKISREKGEAAIKFLEKKGPVWVARWRLANGMLATKVGFTSKRKALAYEAEHNAKVAAGDVSSPKYARATVGEIFDFYLEHQIKGKASEPNVKPHLAFARKHLGSMRLDRIAANAHDILHPYIFKTAAAEYPNRKTLFNHFVYVRAAFRVWAAKRQLIMADMWKVIDFQNPKTRREVTTNFDQYRRCVAEASKPKYPAWVLLFIVVAWEYGRRTGETHKLTWEEIHLIPESRHDLPWLRIHALKQGRVVLDDLPMTGDVYRVLKSLWREEAKGPVVPWHRSVVTKWVRKVLDAAGCEGIILHDSRRGYSSTRSDLTREQRMDFKGQRTPESDEWYRTEKRKGLEASVRDSYDAALLAEIEESVVRDPCEIIQ
jgi:hypothetical protein